MKLQEASNYLSAMEEDYADEEHIRQIEALVLGREALDFLIRWRDRAEIQPYPLLRSETTD